MQWLALKPRPDIACVVAMCASLQTRDPREVVRVCEEIWKYVLHTRDVCCDMSPDPDTEWIVRISADANWAPRGDRSRTGVVIRVMGVIVHGLSHKQSIAAFASHEAELNAAATGVNVGICIRNLTSELRERPPTLKLDQDSKSTIVTMLHEVT